MTNGNEYLTVEEVANRLRVTKDVVRSRIREGKLPASKFGKEYRIQVADLDAYLKAVS
jgi:excisionase family DNA binding protein